MSTVSSSLEKTSNTSLHAALEIDLSVLLGGVQLAVAEQQQEG